MGDGESVRVDAAKLKPDASSGAVPIYRLWRQREHHSRIAEEVASLLQVPATRRALAVSGARRSGHLPARWLRTVRGVDALITLANRIAGTSAQAGEPRLDDENGNTPVHISFLLDRSGSMAQLADAVVSGYNEFVRSQQRGAGECSLTTVQFDSEDPFEVLVADANIAQVTPWFDGQFQPRGMTPLFDAIGSLLDHAEGLERQRASRGLAPRDQIVVVFTDGLENASRRYAPDVVFRRIEELKAVGWTFVFMGANQDSYATGDALGLDAGNVSDWDASPAGARLAFRSFDRASHSYRDKDRNARLRQREDYFEGIKEAERR